MEDAYDVRAVEARLAAMEAARRARAALTKPAMVYHHDVPHATVVGDFELSAVDASSSSDEDESSASETEDVGSTPTTRRTKKPTLRDSLDLSMSMSIAIPTDKSIGSRKAGVKSKSNQQHDRRELEETARVQPRAVAVTASTAGGGDSSGSDEIFVGKLVQRRREMERQVEPPSPQTRPQQLLRHNDMDSMRSSQVAQICPAPQVVNKGGLKAPAVVVSRVPTRSEFLATTHHREHSHELRKLEPERGTVKIEEPALRPSKSKSEALRSNDPTVHERPREALVRPAIGVISETVSNSPPEMTGSTAASKRQSEASASVPAKTATVPAVAPQLPSRQHTTQALPVRPPAASELLAPKVPVTAAVPKKPSVPIAMAATVVASSATTTPATASKTSGYARVPVATSNQAVAPPTDIPSAAKKTHSPSKREPEDHPADDFIDDLLTAEELRLRESLDKLTNRLSSLATARTTMTASRTANPPSNQSTVPDSSDKDDNKTIRAASYGGGTHSRLHQPASPTTRASHARRLELSGGVHKARVRTGGVTAQEAAASRMETAADGKHKIVIKRDLAHLLF